MAAPRGPRGENVTVVSGTEEDGTQGVQVFAAAGVRPSKHKSAKDFEEELIADGIPRGVIHVRTMAVK